MPHYTHHARAAHKAATRHLPKGHKHVHTSRRKRSKAGGTTNPRTSTTNNDWDDCKEGDTEEGQQQ